MRKISKFRKERMWYKLLLTSLLLMSSSLLYAQKVEDFIEAAEKGNSTAQYNLGKCYATEGNGVQAIKWYTRAGENHNAEAAFELSKCYAMGLYVNKDLAMAHKWLLSSANRGMAEAQWQLGWDYAHGDGGVDQDYSQALFWFKKSAEQNYTSAYLDLAFLYADGNGVAKDFATAHKMIDAAISLMPNSSYYFDKKGEIYLKENNVEKAKEIWLQFKERFPSDVAYILNKPDSNNYAFCVAMLKMESEMQDGIDRDIPVASTSAENTFAFIIANESYKRVAQVPYAKNDGEIFAEYCKKTLGVPTNNVKIWNDATLADMKYVITKIKQIAEAYDGDASIILYYAGHGIPSDDQQNSYLLPADGYSADASGLSLNDLYKSLSSVNAKSIFVILDACFSGAQRNGEMLASTRGVAIKPKQETPEGNLIVLSAAQGDETALPYEEKNHGLFSYFLLKKLQESKGNCTMGELSDYIITNVKRTSITIGDKMQTPKVSASSTMGDWRNMKLR